MRRLIWAFLAAALLATTTAASAAEPFPTHPVRIVVGFAPGGGADGIARVLAESMGRSLGEAVYVENRPGANTTLAAAYVAAAPADGYTLLLGTESALGADKVLYNTVKYDADSFSPIAKVASSFFVLAASLQSGIRTLDDLQALARKGGKPVFFASPGGAYLDLFSAELQRISGVTLEQVLYKGGAPAAMAVVSGEAPLTMMGPAALLPLAREGKVTPVGITKAQRSALTGEIPTLAEEGLKGFQLGYWYGLLGPAGLPPEISQKLSDAVAAALRDPAVQQRINALGFEPERPDSLQAFKGRAREEGGMLRDRILKAGIKPQ